MSELRVDVTESMAEIVEVSALFETVWGRNAEGVPMSSEFIRSLVHADGLVSVVHSDGGLIGAAVLGRARPGHCYGYIAAAAPGRADRGIGFALKQHQRTWALAAEIHTMEWTFDPLVARNARFNLTKLGADVREYEVAFYGEMHDEQNAGEIGDRLVAHWRLDSERSERAARGEYDEPPAPSNDVLAAGPDGEPLAWHDGDHRWVRVPGDIQELRRTDPEAARPWRLAVREAFTDAFADGWVADGVTRLGTYHLSRKVLQG